MNQHLKEQLKMRADLLELDNKALAERTNLREERIAEIMEGEELSAAELLPVSRALEFNLGVLSSIAEGNGYQNPFMVTAKTIEEDIKKGNIDGMLTAFVNNRFIVLDDELYIANPKGRCTKKIPTSVVVEMFDALLKKGYVDTVSSYTTSKCKLDIRSLHDLEKYGEKVKTAYLFGNKGVSLCKNSAPLVILPSYFNELVNDFPDEDKRIVLTELAKRMEKMRTCLEKRITKGASLMLLDDLLIYSEKRSSTVIYLHNFENIKGEAKLIGEIQLIQDEIKNMAKKGAKQ